MFKGGSEVWDTLTLTYSDWGSVNITKWLKTRKIHKKHFWHLPRDKNGSGDNASCFNQPFWEELCETVDGSEMRRLYWLSLVVNAPLFAWIYTSWVFSRISKSTRLHVSCEQSSPLDDPSCLSWKNWHLTYVKYCSYMLSTLWRCFLCERVVVVWFQPFSLGKREEGTQNSQHSAWCDPGILNLT